MLTSQRKILPTGRIKPQRVLLDRRNLSLDIEYRENALDASVTHVLAMDSERTKRILVWISCLEHFEYRSESRFASRTIRSRGRCNRNDTRSTACGEMARKCSRVLPRRRTFEMSCSVHGNSSNWGSIGSHTSQSFSNWATSPPFLGNLLFSAVPGMRKWEFAGKYHCSMAKRLEATLI